jgi:predicted N-acetyltransferase YhbS
MRTIRRAESTSDRLSALEVAHAATRPEKPLAQYQASRLALPRRALATWWLLEEDGRAQASLLCYPLRFATSEGPCDGYGIGAVATRPEARRRGIARALCEAAIESAEAEGRALGLLYSAIPAAYYERLGFRAVPAWQHVAGDLVGLADSGPETPLAPLDPRREAKRLAALYEAHHEGGLHLHRDAAAFAASIALSPRDFYFGVGDPLVGYVRVEVDEGIFEVLEPVLPSGDLAGALRTLARLAAGLGCKQLRGWFPPVADLASWLVDEGREKTLPMLRGAVEVGDARFWPSDYF